MIHFYLIDAYVSIAQKTHFKTYNPAVIAWIHSGRVAELPSKTICDFQRIDEPQRLFCTIYQSHFQGRVSGIFGHGIRITFWAGLVDHFYIVLGCQQSQNWHGIDGTLHLWAKNYQGITDRLFDCTPSIIAHQRQVITTTLGFAVCASKLVRIQSKKRHNATTASGQKPHGIQSIATQRLIPWPFQQRLRNRFCIGIPES